MRWGPSPHPPKDPPNVHSGSQGTPKNHTLKGVRAAIAAGPSVSGGASSAKEAADVPGLLGHPRGQTLLVVTSSTYGARKEYDHTERVRQRHTFEVQGEAHWRVEKEVEKEVPARSR